jgi:holo-[acyl-carrier protein] synthase
VIIGIGHDICDQRRIGAIFDRFGMRFSARILTREEQAELQARKNKYAYLAGRFAVKEAVYKALAAADQTEMRWHHAATLSGKNGAPQLILSGACLAGAKTLLPPGHGLKLHISLSDEPPYSSAFVVLSAEQETE